MNPYLWYAITQAATVVITVGTVSLLERRRLRVSGNFQRKQEHYADLFDILYRVTYALKKWNSDVYSGESTRDLDALEELLEAKDVRRLDALNQIWASEAVIENSERWIKHRQELGLALSTIQNLSGLHSTVSRISLKEKADIAEGKLVLQLEEVRKAIQIDLYLNKRRGR